MPPGVYEPHWTDVISAITAAGAFVILLVGAIIALVQVKQTTRNRHAQLMADLSRRYDELGEGRHLAAENLTPIELRDNFEDLYRANDPSVYVLLKISNFFEDLSVMVKQGSLPIEIVRSSLAGPLFRAWDHWAPSVMFLRQHTGRDSSYEGFEKLARLVREKPSAKRVKRKEWN